MARHHTRGYYSPGSGHPTCNPVVSSSDEPTRDSQLHQRPEVMNPPQSAAEGCEARNLNTANVMGLEQVHRATEARPAEVAPLPSDGYKDAFYQIAELLGMAAMPVSPKEAFETVMLPRLRKLAGLADARMTWNSECRCGCSACAAFDMKLKSALNRDGDV